MFYMFYSFLTCAVISFEGGVKRYNFWFKEYITRLDRAGSRSLGFSKPGSHAAFRHEIFFRAHLTVMNVICQEARISQFVVHVFDMDLCLASALSFLLLSAWSFLLLKEFHRFPPYPWQSCPFFALHIQTPPDKMPSGPQKPT